MRCLSFLCLVFLLAAAAAVSAADHPLDTTHWVHGEIVEVFPEQNKVRVLSDGVMQVYKLAGGAEIYRGGCLVSLVSCRPITESRFQECLLFLNELGEVTMMLMDYSIAEIQTEAGNFLVYYDIFGRVKDVEQFPPFERDLVVYSE